MALTLSLARFLCRPTASRLKAAAAKRYAGRLDQQLACFDARIDPNAPVQRLTPFCAAPVFILSAGWRSGSTLLQRMVMANNPEIIIWGEPYAAASPVLGMVDQLRPFSEEWPSPDYFVDGQETDLSKEWVANLYPPVASFRAAHHAYLETLFAEPAQALGYAQWGMKEVRFGADQVRYLRWLYPEAKFIFLLRNPADAYRSYSSRLNWYARWPDRMVSNPYDFGVHWARLARDFLALREQGLGLLLRYEDLGDENTVAALSGYLGWDVPPRYKMGRVRGWNGANSKSRQKLARLLLRRGTGRIVKEFGYA